MDETKSKNNGPQIKAVKKGNFIANICKFILFWVVLFFLVSFTRSFLDEVALKNNLNLNILFLSMVSAFIFYTFIADLNDVYKKIQDFFSHSTFIGQVVPFMLIVASIFYLVIPKLLGLKDFDKNIFLFIGGFIIASHMIYIARENRGKSFGEFSNYLLTISTVGWLNLIFLLFYLRIGYQIDVGAVIYSGFQAGWGAVQTTFTQLTNETIPIEIK